MGAELEDRAVRERALDPERSFLVQAPAGSGKTELLTQRYLRLLATVDAPEEVVAITFTRKAAGEMRARILEAIAHASDPAPEGAHRRRSRSLATAVRRRDAALGWSLAEHPARLRIQTIDALCAGLTRRMPWLSRFGAPPAIAEPFEPLYREAARATLRMVESGSHWSEAIARLLLHLDNDFPRAEVLLVRLLGRRDQWQRHLRRPGLESGALRVELETALGRVAGAHLAALREHLAGAAGADLARLAGYAGGVLAAQGKASPVTACAGMEALPAGTPDEVGHWLGLAELLLTGAGTWRKSLDARIGVPAGKGAAALAMRAMGKELLEHLADDEDLRARLHGVRTLPAPRYDDGQWEVLQALFELLHLALAQLRIVFQARGRVDYLEIDQAAVEALGEEDAPTDLALVLDYRIRHLLVDEFQDTSYTHYELLRRLTAGWSPGDGRTLFVVGDPMQSIYRFREADVALYLDARVRGIGPVTLEPLQLSANFRSTAGLVDWVNRAFPSVFPSVEDALAGAVTYRPSSAVHGPGPVPAVRVHAFADAGPDAQAQEVVRLIRETRAAEPDGRIAVLVRARSHLSALLPALRAADLPFQAVEIDALGERPVVRDLLALTRALLHPADRVAWLAVLRAPWCGLELADLHALVCGAPDTPVPALWGEPERRAALSEGGRERLQRVATILETALGERQRRPLAAWVEGTWLALWGPACMDGAGLGDAEVFLELLDALDEGGDLADLEQLQERVMGLRAPPDPRAPDTLQVMSIHKAKGLEFDTVIVPHLERGTPPGTRPLLRWTERRGADGADLLLAPITADGAQEDPIYRYLRDLDVTAARHEAARVLYVAATRARGRLHLLGQVGTRGDDGDLRAPPRDSLLALLWPVVESEFRAAAAHTTRAPALPESAPRTAAGILRRLPADWRAPAPEAAVDRSDAPPARAMPGAGVEFEWAGDTARHTGTVVHRALRCMARDGLASWDRARLQGARAAWRIALRRLGVAPDELDEAAARVHAALVAVREDPRAHWILSDEHREARSEYAVTGVAGGAIRRAVIDRTFVDAQGVRWIIDYKTGGHEGADVETFLDRERERYRDQLEGYAALLRSADARPVRLALYFPLLRGWREWAAPEQT